MRAEDWISVEDALPPCSGEYLILMTPSCSIFVSYSAVHQAFNAWDDDPDTPNALKPTHWMPIVLPEGYGDEE
nr:MAG TPA: Protein of unknown function (DUF551) [Bacteriophage sp.]